MDRKAARKAQVRLASIVIVVAMVGWLGVTALGGALDLPIRYAFLADMLCMAALFWAGWVLFRVWREQRAEAGEGK